MLELELWLGSKLGVRGCMLVIRVSVKVRGRVSVQVCSWCFAVQKLLQRVLRVGFMLELGLGLEVKS